MEVLDTGNGGIKLNSWIEIHWSFSLFFVCEMIMAFFTYDLMKILLVFILIGPIWLVTILMHELGHILTTQLLGGEVPNLVICPLGGLSLFGPTDQGPRGDLKVAISGPMTHIPMIGIWYAIYYLAGGSLSELLDTTITDIDNFSDFNFFLTKECVWMNIIILLFNTLIPVYPLDGGRVAAALLIMNGMNPAKVASIISITGMTIGLLFAVWALFDLLVGYVFSAIVTIIFASFLFYSGKDLNDLTNAGRFKEHPLFGRDCFNVNEISQSNGLNNNRIEESAASSNSNRDGEAQESENEEPDESSNMSETEFPQPSVVNDSGNDFKPSKDDLDTTVEREIV